MDEQKQRIIEDYFEAYNALDPEEMVKNLHDNILFEHVANGEVGLKTEGLEAFAQQAKLAVSYFSEREISITSWKFEKEMVTVGVDFKGTLAINMEQIGEAGDVLQMKGFSEFQFLDGRLVLIRDIS